MAEFLLGHEPTIRFAAFVGVFVGMAIWEAAQPRRPRISSRWKRWPSNLGIVALNTGLLRLVIPTGAVSLAILGEQRGWGLLSNIALPTWLRIAVALVVLDLAIYLQHVIFHALPALWRLHRMHHSDTDFDVTTGSRFHPGEILLSMVYKMAVVVALGAPAVSVVLFEVLLNVASMFNHGNLRLSARFDRVLRWAVVTPDMHRVHHSSIPAETNSNFGFNVPWWDRIFGTYKAQPAAGHLDMQIGLDNFRDPVQLRLDRMLVQPFVEPTGRYPLGARTDDP